MAGDTSITIIGNLVADAELRFTPSGQAVANFTVASTPSYFDRDANEWKDKDTLFMRCSIWREAAENVAESLTKGTRVIVTGRLKPRSWEKDGQKHTVLEMDVDEIGPSLRYATAKVTRTQRGGGQGGGYGSSQGRDESSYPGAGQTGDPWATPAAGDAGAGAQGGGWGGGAPSYDEPPF